MSPLDPLEILQVIGYSIGALLPLWMLFQLVTHRSKLTSIERILAACEATLDDVVKVSVFLADMATSAQMSEAYLSVFTGDLPARITVGGVALALGAAVEIDCIAYRIPRPGSSA